MSKVYKGAKTREISFPLGGIGSGSIGLAGNGRLIDWEIFNRPNKKSFNGFSHFAIKAEQEGRLLDARILNGDLQGPYIGEHIRGGPWYSGYGFGPESQTMAGMPHFEDTEFIGEFPLAGMKFADPSFPGRVELLAFNPFIPLNDQDSSIPAAFFEWEIDNCTEEPITYTIALSAGNPIPTGRITHQYKESASETGQTLHTLVLSSNQYEADHPQYGDLCIATDAEEVSRQDFWYRGGWCDALEMYWRDFARPGIFQNRTYAEEMPPSERHKDTATLAAHITLKPGEKGKVRFAISWSFPNMVNFWNPQKEGTNSWRHYYASLFENAEASGKYALEHWDRLLAETTAFKEALFSSTVPEVVIEAVSANLSVLKSATCLRLTDGSFYGFEGLTEDTGSCEGSCTHVWNYAYALPFLFPKLERSMRDLDFRYNSRSDGRMSFRLMLPVGREQQDFHACADGQFGGVVKAYRDWKISGNTEWLKSNWPAIRHSIEYAWADTNDDQWDPLQKGVLEGRQHHTLDMELYGPNSWLTGFYLAALKAGSEMAACLGESDTAEAYLRIFEKGKAWVNQHLFNGSYYSQLVDLTDPLILPRYGEGAVQGYWNEELGEMKYQIADGCVIDQVIAQWHANLCGLGEIFDKGQTRIALRSLYRHNYKSSMRNEANTWRLYSLNDEAGIVICTWPEGTTKPSIPLTYNSETMTGFEYQAASHMIQEGLIEEGLSIVKAIRDRYDGEKRNPWNEIECGSNYARSMASYSLLHAFSGFEFDMVHGIIGFQPVLTEGGEYRTFWSLDQGWGVFEMSEDHLSVSVLSGGLTLKALKVALSQADKISHIQFGDDEVGFDIIGNTVHFQNELVLQAERAVVLQLNP
ncbi:non-lysosomal glucosylceramidase [Paenibacillus glycanilyticus]|uniref:GH116 family glycosyl-hydrolase n=1 Tax=Paenibacillus glycanilyticus TaxID=126569 RepID=UPI002040417A|nr:GH116 family glycosyl-hydrolase [Paenibacillus glycanilyticus]MCM3628730.1 non-lysosomal glucosylceramidase [Paenibacillus glycanilyticus]